MEAAWRRRAGLRASGTTAYRLVHGAGDGLPGVTCDVFGDYGRLSLDAAAVLHHEDLAMTLHRVAGLRGLYGAGDALEREEGRGGLLAGAEAPDEFEVLVDGLCYGIRIAEGDKAGLYLDQRENRAALALLLPGRRVLNLFAFTGAWSVAAAAAGSAETTNVDLSRRLLARARENFARNGLDPAGHRFVAADARDYLALAARKGLRFGAAILDPPSFAHGRRGKGRFEARRDWPVLVAETLAVLSPGGLLAASSHTPALVRAGFPGLLARAARAAGRRLEILGTAGGPSDFPAGGGEGMVFVLARAE